jgi:hypothetical protein
MPFDASVRHFSTKPEGTVKYSAEDDTTGELLAADKFRTILQMNKLRLWLADCCRAVAIW